MTFRPTRFLALALIPLTLGAAALTSPMALAQGSGVTRAQVKMDRDMFLAMARWDELAGKWVLRDNMPLPAGVPTREEIKSMRDKFLSMHTWNELSSQFVPHGGAPRDMSKLPRDQVKMETERFVQLYRFDEVSGSWQPKSR